jgi:hypothetical protein
MAAAKLIECKDDHCVIQITVPFGKSMLASEDSIQSCLNEAGALATGKALEQFDTDGSPIIMGDVKWTSKGKITKPYQTPYGETIIERYVYQTSSGGRGFCPLERDARIILTSTPRFAKVISSKYSEMGSSRVIEDLEGNHGRKIARSFMQNICDAIGAVAFAKEEDWKYELPEMEKAIHSISVGLDGTCMLMTEDGYRQAMVGTIAFYDREGERQHTIYTAAAPEYGKATFLSRLETEIERVKTKFPKAHYIGLADGAKDNWDFLIPHTQRQVVDFYHAAGYLGKAAEVMFKGEDKQTENREWLDQACHDLKNKQRSAGRLLHEIEEYKDEKRLQKDDREEMDKVVSYFTNNKNKMNYAEAIEENLPIGSGVTEAACKVIVKQRLGGSGMKWGGRGAAIVLSLRALNYSTGRWNQFWNKIDQYGFPVAA